jgi:hypothetical protein
MKRFFGLFVLTPAEQRVVIVLVLLLLLAAWSKHHRDLQNTIPIQSAPGASATPQGTAISKSPTNQNGCL